MIAKKDDMKYACYIALMAILLNSCIKDEPKNMECDILEAWIEGDDLAQYFSQTTDMRISDVPSSTDITDVHRQAACSIAANAHQFQVDARCNHIA